MYFDNKMLRFNCFMHAALFLHVPLLHTITK